METHTSERVAATTVEAAPDYLLTPPETMGQRLKKVGPGIVVAATGVGTADLITSIVIGTQFGMTFIWAILVGSILKYFLNEGVGRWHLASERTMVQGWQQLGKWATGYFGVYSILWGFVYGATAASTCAMALYAVFPVIPLWAWAAIHAVAGFLLVWFGKYHVVEKVMTVLIGIMFLTIIGTALLFLPSFGEFMSGFVPRVPDGSFMLMMGLIGGVGGTITMASYGYWLAEKKWSGPKWVSTMRLDSKVAYTLTAIFTIAGLVIGAQFLFGTDVNLRGDQGLIDLAGLLGQEFGEPMKWVFLVAFWSAAFSSLLGVWNGVPYLFADFVQTIRQKKDAPRKQVQETDKAYRFFLFWLTFPPMILYFFGKPVELVILYGALGSLFMPFLAISLLVLLNSKKIDQPLRNKTLPNVVLVACVAMFVYLGGSELINILFK
ncbi:Nramp family divalent metal transporter [Ureibacillus sp. GCM10028918]|uniref:Nramp family divalent metal transporter n=1 Tax=Ureibacillus sp. GCM10028918 TaxID=3273429 RepID=UPI003616EAD1